MHDSGNIVVSGTPFFPDSASDNPKTKKKIAVIASVVLLVAIAGVLSWFLFFSKLTLTSKEDAKRTLGEFNVGYSKIITSYDQIIGLGTGVSPLSENLSINSSNLFIISKDDLATLSSALAEITEAKDNLSQTTSSIRWADEATNELFLASKESALSTLEEVEQNVQLLERFYAAFVDPIQANPSNAFEFCGTTAEAKALLDSEDLNISKAANTYNSASCSYVVNISSATGVGLFRLKSDLMSAKSSLIRLLTPVFENETGMSGLIETEALL